MERVYLEYEYCEPKAWGSEMDHGRELCEYYDYDVACWGGGLLPYEVCTH